MESECAEVVLEETVVFEAELQVSLALRIIVNWYLMSITDTIQKISLPRVQDGGKSGDGRRATFLVNVAYACDAWSFDWEQRNKYASNYRPVRLQNTLWVQHD